MGYRGKLKEQEQARALRAKSWTLMEIADELGVSQSSVSLWVRDVEFTPKPRKTGRLARGTDHPWRRRKLAQIEALNAEGVERLGELDDRDLLLAGVALYAGEGSKTDGSVGLANTNPELVRFFASWLRRFFAIDEERLRGHLYLHEGLDLEAAMIHWSEVVGIPPDQFMKPYRAVPDDGIRTSKHEFGCLTVRYSCSRTHREIMGLVRALPIVPWKPRGHDA